MALKGIKVIELAGLAPGPFCGMILADFGANVLRVDKIGAGTEVDVLDQGKQSISLNLKNKNGINVFKKICQQSDVLIEPFRQGVMENLGLGPNILLQENPGLIYARLTGYGQKGPYSKSAGHDINYIGLSGILSLFGRAGEKPLFPINLAADFGGGGLTCALGIVMALYERSKSGKGQIIDCNMVEGSAYLGSWLFRSQKLPVWGRERGKNILDSGAHFYEVYETKDKKYLTVGAIEHQFYSNLLKGLGLSEDDVPQWSDFEKSKQLFEKKFKEKTLDEWCSIFDHLDACVAPLLNLNQVSSHPHNKERNSFLENNGETVPKPAPILSRTPGISASTKNKPERGEHTKEILKGLGYSDQDISKLAEEGAVEYIEKAKL